MFIFDPLNMNKDYTDFSNYAPLSYLERPLDSFLILHGHPARVLLLTKPKMS